MRRLLLILTLVIAGWPLHAQDKTATEPVKAEAPKPDAVTLAELIDSYRQMDALAMARMRDADAIVAATPEYKKLEAVRQQADKLRADLTAKIKAKTGKAMDWQTGQLK